MKRASVVSIVRAGGSLLLVLALLVLLVSALAMYGCKSDPIASSDEESASGSLDNGSQQTPANCFPNLTPPKLAMKGSREITMPDGHKVMRYRMVVANRSVVPAAFFELAPELPPCGASWPSTRAWVYIDAPSGDHLCGFCGFREASLLDRLWFSRPMGWPAPDFVYVDLWDRLCDAHHTSNLAATTVVSLDIKPGGCPNPLNFGSNGVLPVAILGSADFDVHDIDVSSLLLEGVPPLRSSIEDVGKYVDKYPDICRCSSQGPDGYDDLTLKFKTQDIMDVLGAPFHDDIWVLTITGSLLDGTPFEGSDCVGEVGHKKRDHAFK